MKSLDIERPESAMRASTIAQSMSTSFRSAALATPGTSSTWNGAVSHATTGIARVDLFYSTSRGLDSQRLAALAAAAFDENPLDTLKIGAFVRDIRGGKGERSLGRHFLEWLATHKQLFLEHNLDSFVAKFGRFDDAIALMNTPLEDKALELWATQLKKDLAALEDDAASISLAAKWIPSENKSEDKRTRVNKKLAKKLGLKNSSELRKMYLSPLRKRLDILERRMCAKDWEGIQFSHVPSVAMKIHGRPGKAFDRNSGVRFAEYKQSLASGETKVNAKDLFPHQIVDHYLTQGFNEVDQLVEAQWKVMLSKGHELGDLSNVLVMSDVSGSMSGLPMQISIALGILVSQLTSEAWKGLVMTFESTPRFHMVTGSTLRDQVRCLQHAPWGGSTNFQAALELILDTAKRGNLRQDVMPKRLIVVSDMQFDCANDGNTNYHALASKYKAAGYNVPHLVFWNVNGCSSDFPTTSAMPNVSLVSGYSPHVLKAVLKGEEITPFDTMMNAIQDERYDCITLPPSDLPSSA
ncbi:hypothetical protein HDU79_009851 [Rhizoclosmatium sp. JEL0117]|nr:hypothetical protein HDU79_009851 [Rhizoclosmatium sp. JEL0117]